MDWDHADEAGYLGILIFINVFYLSLMLALTYLFLHVRKSRDDAPPNSSSKEVSTRVAFTNFIFLQLTLLCKLVTAVIILIHVCGLTNEPTLNLTVVRLFYSASGLFLCIAYFINLYQWLFIAMRVNLYGGKFGGRSFRKRVYKSKCTNLVVGLVIFVSTLLLILLEVFCPMLQVT